MTQHTISEVDGIRVVTEPVAGVRSASIGVWIGAGSVVEPDGCFGHAHFVEHMLFKGNERWNAERISRWFDRIGSDGNAATTKEYTVVHSRVLDTHVVDTMEVMGEIVLRPGFAAPDVDAEREVILEEIAMYEDSPSDVVHELADHLVYDPHPFARPILGSSDHVAATTADGVRRFHSRWYVPQNIVVSAVGSVDHAEFVAAVHDRFVGGYARPGDIGGGRREPPPPGAGRRRGRIVARDAEQVHLCISGIGVGRRDERRHAVALLDVLFGGTPSSRLFQEIRERRGLAYSVYSFTSQHSDTGQIGMYTAVRPDRVDELLTVLDAELESIRTQPPGEEELAQARDHVEGRLLLAMESTAVRSNRLGSAVVTGVPLESVVETVHRLNAVTPEDVHAVAQELFDPSRLSVAGVTADPGQLISSLSGFCGYHRHEFDAVPALEEVS